MNMEGKCELTFYVVIIFAQEQHNVGHSKCIAKVVWSSHPEMCQFHQIITNRPLKNPSHMRRYLLYCIFSFDQTKLNIYTRGL